MSKSEASPNDKSARQTAPCLVHDEFERACIHGPDIRTIDALERALLRMNAAERDFVQVHKNCIEARERADTAERRLAAEMEKEPEVYTLRAEVAHRQARIDELERRLAAPSAASSVDQQYAASLADAVENCRVTCKHEPSAFDLEQQGYDTIIRALRLFARSSEGRLFYCPNCGAETGKSSARRCQAAFDHMAHGDCDGSAASTNNALAPGERKPGEIAGPSNDDAPSRTPRTLDRASQEQAQPAEGTHTDHPARHFDRTCPACIASESHASSNVEELRSLLREARLYVTETHMHFRVLGPDYAAQNEPCARCTLRDKIDAAIDTPIAAFATSTNEGDTK